MSPAVANRTHQQDDAARKAGYQIAWDVIEAKRRAHPELRGAITLEGLRAVAAREGVHVPADVAGVSAAVRRTLVAYRLASAWLAGTPASPVRAVFNLLGVPENIVQLVVASFLPTAAEARCA